MEDFFRDIWTVNSPARRKCNRPCPIRPGATHETLEYEAHYGASAFSFRGASFRYDNAASVALVLRDKTWFSSLFANLHLPYPTILRLVKEVYHEQ